MAVAADLSAAKREKIDFIGALRYICCYVRAVTTRFLMLRNYVTPLRSPQSDSKNARNGSIRFIEVSAARNEQTERRLRPIGKFPRVNRFIVESQPTVEVPLALAAYLMSTLIPTRILS
jgi:hypothetical protein